MLFNKTSMENKSNISDRSLSNFTHFSDEAISQISDLSTSHVNYSDLNQNQLFIKQTNKLEFWNTYNDIIKHQQFDQGYFLMECLLIELEQKSSLNRHKMQSLPEQWINLIKTFSQTTNGMNTWQKPYYRSIARCCMAQCIYYSDGK
jgi:hypothetical protein